MMKRVGALYGTRAVRQRTHRGVSATPCLGGATVRHMTPLQTFVETQVIAVGCCNDGAALRVNAFTHMMIADKNTRPARGMANVLSHGFPTDFAVVESAPRRYPPTTLHHGTTWNPFSHPTYFLALLISSAKHMDLGYAFYPQRCSREVINNGEMLQKKSCRILQP